MDIRNSKNKPTPVSKQELLKQFFEYNREQMRGYKEIEKLPDWPFDLNVPSDQEILKSFIGNVIEELTEGFESYNAIYEVMSPLGFNKDQVQNPQVIINHLQNANEELADAMGFYLALFEFSNIMPEDILSYKDCQDTEELFEKGVALTMKECSFVDFQHYGYRVIDINQLSEEDLIIMPGFREIDDVHLDNIRILLFQVIYHLSTARNLLKSRIWKQTPVMTKELEYQEELVRSFYIFTGYLTYIGVSPDDLYCIFYKKQQLNLFRQNSNY